MVIRRLKGHRQTLEKDQELKSYIYPADPILWYNKPFWDNNIQLGSLKWDI